MPSQVPLATAMLRCQTGLGRSQRNPLGRSPRSMADLLPNTPSALSNFAIFVTKFLGEND
ncbi:MAG: hypothetical protein ACK58N_10125 [Synechocystis sp.]